MAPRSTKETVIRLFHLNIQSLRNKINLLEGFLADKEIDVLCLSEHWLKREELNNIRVADYTTATGSCRNQFRGGGTAILMNPHYEFSLVPDVNALTVEKCIEVCGIFLKSLKAYIISIYRSPSGSFNTFLQILECLLSGLGCASKIIIVGDFNVCFGTDSRECTELCGMLESYGLLRVVTSATRQGNCLDGVFSNFPEQECGVSLFDADLSDHLGQMVVLSCSNDSNITSTNIACRPITVKGKNTFFNLVDRINWDFLDEEGSTANEKCSQFLDLITQAFRLAFPVKTYTKKSNQNHTTVWFDDNLKSMREWLHFLNELYNQNPSPWLNEYKTNYRSFYKAQITATKKLANDNLIKNAPNPVRCMWNIINEYRGVTKKESPSATISPDDFNNYFVNIAINIQQEVGPSARDPLDNTFETPQDEFLFHEVTLIEMRDTINSLKDKKSKDIFDLNVDLVKGVKNLIISPLTKLINLCFRESIFPDVLKEAMVVPIFKKGDQNDVSNYRPISLLPIFSKIFERCMARRISHFFESHGLFTDSQFGFRQHRNTTLAILELVSYILKAFDDNSYVSSTFCDLSKAFDCVTHSILLEKLKLYNFHPDSLSLIRSYLAGRYQRVRAGGGVSSRRELTVGVPQGSVLGPLLFLIYINDLPNVSPSSHFALFADDTTISCVSKEYKGVKDASVLASTEANEWFAANRLFLNAEKTQNMDFTMRRVPEGAEAGAEGVGFLGVRLDRVLRWDAHVDMLCGRLATNIFVLRNLANCVSPSVLRQAYFSLCHSHIQYAILVWGHSAGAARVFGLQRRALRIISGTPYRQDCRQDFINNKVLTLPSLFILENLLYVRTNIGQYTPHESVHSYATRNRQNLVLNAWRLGRCQDGPGHLAIHFFNKLPETIRDLPLHKYKFRLKNFLCSRAFYSTCEFLNCDISEIL